MGEFVEKSVSKTAARDLATPIADISAFGILVNSVLVDNPFERSAYQIGTVSHQPVEKTRETYTTRIAFQDADAKTVGQVVARGETSAGYSANIATITGSTAISTAMGGTPSHDPADDTFSVTLKCHDQNGEVYAVTLTRNRITISSYADEGILGRIATWADSVPALT